MSAAARISCAHTFCGRMICFFASCFLIYCDRCDIYSFVSLALSIYRTMNRVVSASDEIRIDVRSASYFLDTRATTSLTLCRISLDSRSANQMPLLWLGRIENGFQGKTSENFYFSQYFCAWLLAITSKKTRAIIGSMIVINVTSCRRAK